MPSRQNIKTITTPIEIQGDDAWVKIKSITVDEAKALQNLTIEIDKKFSPERERLLKEYADSKNLEVDKLSDSDKIIALANSDIAKKSEEFFYDYYSNYVVGWNWVTEKIDEKTNEPIPMEQPYKNPSVFGKLTSDEFSYIQSLFKQDEIDEKK